MINIRCGPLNFELKAGEAMEFGLTIGYNPIYRRQTYEAGYFKADVGFYGINLFIGPIWAHLGIEI